MNRKDKLDVIRFMLNIPKEFTIKDVIEPNLRDVMSNTYHVLDDSDYEIFRILLLVLKLDDYKDTPNEFNDEEIINEINSLIEWDNWMHEKEYWKLQDVIYCNLQNLIQAAYPNLSLMDYNTLHSIQLINEITNYELRETSK